MNKYLLYRKMVKFTVLDRLDLIYNGTKIFIELTAEEVSSKQKQASLYDILNKSNQATVLFIPKLGNTIANKFAPIII